MLFEAQLLLQLPLAVAIYSPILAPFLNMLIAAIFISLLYLIFQTHLGRNVLGTFGGEPVVHLFYAESCPKHHYHRSSGFHRTHVHSSNFFEPPIHSHPSQTPHYQPKIHGHG